MDEFQAGLARIALDAVGDRGFVLGGGHAVQLHGMVARPSEGIDLFSADRGRPAEVVADVVAAFQCPRRLPQDCCRQRSGWSGRKGVGQAAFASCRTSCVGRVAARSREV